jgi:hypothetical protein
MISLPIFTELVFSIATVVISVLLFRFLATGGPRFTIIGDLDPDVVSGVFRILMWLCGAIVVYQMFHIATLALCR